MKLYPNTTVKHNEGLFFVNLNDILVYHKKRHPDIFCVKKDIPQGEEDNYIIDKEKSQYRYDRFKEKFCEEMQTRCKSLQPGVSGKKFINTTKQKLILENKLFRIVFENNQWSIAVKLLRKDDANQGIAQQTFETFLQHTKDALLMQMPEIYVRNGSWGTTRVTAATPLSVGNTVVEPAE